MLFPMPSQQCQSSEGKSLHWVMLTTILKLFQTTAAFAEQIPIFCRTGAIFVAHWQHHDTEWMLKLTNYLETYETENQPLSFNSCDY